MNIVFGLWADGRTVPEHGGTGEASGGYPVLGPQGFLDTLETALGLSAPRAAEVERIAAWQAKLQAAGDGRFWSRSLAADPWTTSRRTLQMRDDLIAGGWSADTPTKAPRLTDIAAAEMAGDVTPPGLADRMAELVGEIDGRAADLLSEVRLVEQRGDLPPGWRRLLERLEAAGIPVLQVDPPVGASEGGALRRAQDWVRGGGPFAAGGPDQSIVEISADTGLAAAEALGAWIAASGHECRTVIIAEGGDTSLLDQAMSLHGQARGGVSAASPYRGVLQVLPLAFQLAWSPFDAAALLDLLCLHRPPIARRAAAVLSRALEEAPGIGGPIWARAWSEIEAAELARPDEPENRVRERLARWRSWVDPLGADPDQGLEIGLALGVCDRIASWAGLMHASSGESCYLEALQLARVVREALVRIERTHLPRPLVERVIDQALGVGVRDSSVFADSGVCRAVAHAGAFWGEADTVVWWNFVDTGERPPRSPWSAAERAELASLGIELDSPAAHARRLARSWEQPLLGARARLILVRSTLTADGEAPAHPLAHRLAPVLEKDADRVQVEQTCHAERLALCGPEIERRPMEARPLPTAAAIWAAPSGFAAMVAARRQSATSLEDLFACQFQWALKHVGRVRPSRARALPDANRLMGNLAHAMAREVFLPGAAPGPDAASAAAAATFDRLVDEMASPLRSPAAAADLVLARTRLPSAMAALSRALTANQLEIVEAEQAVEGVFGDLSLTGSVDLVARDPAGRLVVIDLKWTRNPKPRREELESGSAVQLAVYAALLHPSSPGEGGYFLLNQREFVVPASGRLQGRAVATSASLAQTWGAVQQTWRDLDANISVRGLVACGVAGAEDHLPPSLSLVREVRCDRCDYRTLCRIGQP